jgi:hypothetical protein
VTLKNLKGEIVEFSLAELQRVKGYEGHGAPDLSAGFPHDFFHATRDYICQTQLASGSIPWFDRGHADPWDHVEAAMALSIMGEFAAAERAYAWLQAQQLEDGSWWAAYKGDEVENKERRESNFVAYIATGIWHHYLISENKQFVASMWPMVSSAIAFVLRLQTEHGEIHWAVDGVGNAKKDALVTGCSSIYKSLECAYNLSVVMNEPREDWRAARAKLGKVLRFRPERFDRTWESKERYSMDWFYPVLSGALPKFESQERLKARWSEFVVEGMGCRCVSDEPWVTIAESCELVMALLAAGEDAKALELYNWLHQWRVSDGSYWTGYQFAEKLLWPYEKPTWTAGAVILAADALCNYSAAAYLFKEVRLLNPA